MTQITITLRWTPQDSKLIHLGSCQAVIEEHKTAEMDEADLEGVCYFTGDNVEACLGHAMLHLSCIENLENGVKLNIENTI